MLSVSPSMMVRSSLEKMLDSLRRRDEDETPKDLPPPLPSRPTSKARRPSAKRRLPNKFESCSTNFSCGEKEETQHLIGRSFGGKKLKESEPDESPVVSLALEDIEFEQRQEEIDRSNLASVSPSSSLPRFPKSDLNDNFGSFIKQKLRVRCQLQNGQWESGQIQSISAETANVLFVNGSVVIVSTGDLLPANSDVLEGVEGLIQLSYLNEQSALHNLQYRYSRDMICSLSGPVAISPFKTAEIYGNDYATAYRQKLLDSPHVYAITDAAYSEMMRDGINQSIITSRESGSGKTETAKIAMQYLGALGGGTGGMELKLIPTSHILEAFGNAKTWNDNSSRLGKLIEVHSSAMGNLCGAKIETFLEKSGEVHSSYHISYQLCAGAPSALREKLNLKAAIEYNYLNPSGCLAIDNIDDAQKFQILMEAPDMIRMSKTDLQSVFEVVVAVLWLDNISFQAIDSEIHVEVVADEASATVASLIGCHCEDLVLALSTNKVRPEKDNVAKNLTLQQNGVLEEARKQALLGILEVQKCFRSHLARRYFHELKSGVISLQSFVRAANARRKYKYLINQREQVVQKTLDEQQRAVRQLQAVIRGWLARKQVNILQNLKKLKQDNSGSIHSPCRRISEVKEMQQLSNQVLPLVVEELQKRVLKAETTLEKKEQENAALRDEMQRYEARWLEYEGKMKSMEDIWQKQRTSLQMSLAAVKRSLAENTSIQSIRQEGSSSPHDYDSDNRNFTETQTPGGIPINLTNSVTEFGAGRQSNGNGNALCNLMKEFEQRKQSFDNGAKALIEDKSGHSASANPEEELRNMKNKFKTWMKDYKARLREAKAKLHKLGLSDAEKGRRKWWGWMSKR